jgi:uncharacterized protein (TIGR03437 family)
MAVLRFGAERKIAVGRADCRTWVVVRMAIVAALSSTALYSQFVTTATAIPRTSKLPVVFLNGYQGNCPQVAGDLNSFRATFGMADQILERNGQATLFFDNCSLPNKPAIETLGSGFREFLERLRYSDGQPVPQVDVVVHSMGGLIVRSYLSGKQVEEEAFNPPADTRIRKLVFLGTPHFGTTVAGLSPDRNPQITELEPGSRFLFDLATWNQGIDDLRGVDAIAVLGNAGNSGLGNIARFHDSTVTLTSGSLEFALPERTRIINFCHTGGLAAVLCDNSEGRLADMTSETHLSARIVMSFLNGTAEWRSIGQSPAENMFLTTRRGLAIEWRDLNNRVLPLLSAMAGQEQLNVRADQIAYGDFVSSNAAQLTLAGGAGTATVSLPTFVGSTRAITVKSGPLIAGVFPVFAAVYPRSLAPGMFISIYGSNLATSTDQAPSLPYPTVLGTTEVRLNGLLLPLHYASPNQINAVLPAVSGLAKLNVKSTAGEHTVNIFIEPAVPALFAGALNGITNTLITPESPLRPGDYVSLFLTGLGATITRGGLEWAATQPEVFVGGRPCDLLYAGRAPGFIGLDQINCRLATDLQVNNATAVLVRSASRTSNTVTLPVR